MSTLETDVIRDVARTVSIDVVDIVSVRDTAHITKFAPAGLQADGVSDWQAVFEAAAASTYQSIYVPAMINGAQAKYLLSVGNIDITGKKFWTDSPKSAKAPYGDVGCQIWTTQTTNPVFIVGKGSVIDGFQFFYPDQDGSTITDVSAYPAIVGAPIVYPPTVKSKTDGVSGFELKNLVFINSYHCIEIGDPGFVFGAGRGLIDNVEAYPVKTFLSTFNVTAAITVSRFILSPVVYQDVAITGDQKLRKWSYQNAEHFDLQRADGLIVTDGISLGSRRAIKVSNNSLNLARFNNVLFDQTLQVLQALHFLSNCKFTDCTVFGNSVFPTLELPADLFVFESPVSAAAAGPVIFTNLTVQEGLRNVIRLNTANCVSTIKINGGNFANYGAAAGLAADACGVFVDPAATGVRVIVDGVDMISSYAAAYGIQANAGTSLKATGNGFRNVFRPIQTSGVTVVQVLDGNTSANTAGGASTSLAGTTVSERGNIWDKPPVTKVDNSPFFVARQSAPQSITASTTLVFATESKDRDLSFNGATGVYTCVTPGAHQFACSVSHGATGAVAGDIFILQIVTSLGNFQKRFTMLATEQSVDLSVVAEMRVGDTAEVKLQRISGTGDFTNSSVANENYFTGRLVD